jgi:hypothetical protein
VPGGGPEHCTDGSPYGVALVVNRAEDIHGTGQGTYADQDATSGELRVYACAALPHLYACATHLSTERPVALRQCRQLMDRAVPEFVHVSGPDLPVVVGGDLNLLRGRPGEPDVRACLPGGYREQGDGGVQHILWSTRLRYAHRLTAPLAHTDHPLLMVRLTRP